MQSEVDAGRFTESAKFCVYLHQRPDGSTFYVGKGLVRRAFDFAPSRRTMFHRNIVSKHGRENIKVLVIPCACEDEAFLLERAHIQLARMSGRTVANLTDGGEGCSGRNPTEKQLFALALGRGKDRVLSDESKMAIIAGLAKGRAVAAATGALDAHRKRIGADGAKRLHQERLINCQFCGAEHRTRSAKARHCGRLCEQRARRKRLADEQR